jgi:RNA polymerase sigma-70 factor (ECF subfamily)
MAKKLSSNIKNFSFEWVCAKLNQLKTLKMTDSKSQEVTELLQKWSDGDVQALEELTPVIYSELHRIAKRYMSRERDGHTLQTTALVNEAYLRLIDWKTAKWENRAHFFGVSAQLMRRILVDFARRRPKASNDEAVRHVELEEALTISVNRDHDLVALDEALTELAKFDERKAKIVELKFFGGLSVEETAEVLDIAGITVLREWQKAKAWLYRELNQKDEG